MFRLWGKMMKENRMLRDIVISNGDYTMSRTAMVFDAIDQICYAFSSTVIVPSGKQIVPFCV